MTQPTPNDALQYLAQVAEDYITTLRPSAAGPVASNVKAALDLLTNALKEQGNGD